MTKFKAAYAAGNGQGNRMKENGSSFRQGMPESSAMDGNVPAAHVRDLGNAAGHRLPSLGDGCIRDILVPHPSGGEAQANRLSCLSGIPAGMTVFFAFLIASCDCPEVSIRCE
jgi:hypothetical protein